MSHLRTVVPLLNNMLKINNLISDFTDQTFANTDWSILHKQKHMAQNSLRAKGDYHGPQKVGKVNL